MKRFVRELVHAMAWPHVNEAYQVGFDQGCKERAALVVIDSREHDIEDLIRYLEGDHHMGVYDRIRLANALRDQLPKDQA